ncbi:transducin/WD-40 repeat-like protein [Cryptosporidium canis]|uniref:Transducin/WD-40 repeat-like protein n=1 Tax=Cryptosporidium canis TaxID=195482 RepID=A0ABQ8P7H0_9CRYT|nr:transducin/WD-40 repeat-like protein [Cryptosporidium canis]
MVLFKSNHSINTNIAAPKNSAPDVDERNTASINAKDTKFDTRVSSFSCSSAAFDFNYNSQTKTELNTKFRGLRSDKISNNALHKSDSCIGSKSNSYSSKKRRNRVPWREPGNEVFKEFTSDLPGGEFNQISHLKGAVHSDSHESDDSEPICDEDQVVSTFLGKERTDYQNRSWIVSPNEIRERTANEHCFVPKKLVKVLNAHTQGVQAIRYAPKTGHLLLSAGLDSQIKIWNINNKCMYIYHGHKNAVRDIQFSNKQRNCKNFYSCGYDKQTLFWDAEYGKIIWKYSNDKTPYCVSAHPTDEHSIIVGYSNKKAIQYDTRSNDIVQEYNEHQGAVNTVVFCEDGKRFVTTSDDKKMFVWDYGIPIVVKHIANPLMQSMPYVSLHSDGQHLVCQSMDNKILVYDSNANYKCTKKRFTGLFNSGYAIQCNSSPDGQYIISGDVNGKLHIWDWKTAKIIRSINAHEGVSMGCQWHPTIPSRITSCGWDGTIKIWE